MISLPLGSRHGSLCPRQSTEIFHENTLQLKMCDDVIIHLTTLMNTTSAPHDICKLDSGISKKDRKKKM